MKFIESAERDFAEEERRLEAEQKELEPQRPPVARDEPQSPEFREILDEVIERQKTALKDEVPASSAPGGPEKRPESARETEAPKANAQTVPDDKQRQAASSKWSLDKLKKDILTGTSKDDETS